MVDIHTHILPGVDDGARDAGEALLLAEDAAAQGVTVMVATPHLFWLEREVLTASQIRHGVAELNSLVQSKGLPLQILSGCEIPLDSHIVERLQNGEWLSLGDSSRSVLVEPPWHEWSNVHVAMLQRLIDSGWIPVLAHPERNSYFQRHVDALEETVRMGAHLQVTTGSILPGRASPATARCAYELLERRLVSVIASDCHNPINRSCNLREAHELLRQTYGKRLANMLTTEAPQALVRGDMVDHAMIQQAYESSQTRDKNRWQRILRAVFGGDSDD